jgi:hypothetical protein
MSAGSELTDAGADSQLNALLRLKAAVDHIDVLHWWNRAVGANAGYCQWEGVQCAQGTSAVTGINLWPGKGVQGLTGSQSIDAQIVSLAQMLQLISTTSVTGTLPANWSRVMKDIEQNHVSQEIDVTGLKGTLPPAAAFAGLPQLTCIAIADQAGISGTLPADWSRLKQLQEVRLFNNSISGSIPPSWGGLVKLKGLGLWYNILKGCIPDSFKALTAMEDLDLALNALTGTVPAWLGCLGNLKELRLRNNKLSGSIPASLGRNQIDGTLPDALKALAAL